MKENKPSVLPGEPAFVEGIEALCDNAAGLDPNKDLKLCSVCMQWACDGPHCHRDDVCNILPQSLV